MWKNFSKFVSRVDSAYRSPSGDSCTFPLKKIQNLLVHFCTLEIFLLINANFFKVSQLSQNYSKLAKYTHLR